jgi:hypothetical protein
VGTYLGNMEDVDDHNGINLFAGMAKVCLPRRILVPLELPR